MMMVRRCTLGRSDYRRSQVEMYAGPRWSHVKSQRRTRRLARKSVGEGPRSRFAARENHARGLPRLCFPGVRADVPHGQENPEEDGHESALRLPKLPPTRAVRALRGGGRGRRMRLFAGQVLGDARRHLRERSHGEDPRRSSAAEAGLDVFRFRREMRRRVHAERIRDIREGAVRSGVASAPAFFINSIRHESSRPGDAARGGPCGFAGVRRIE